MQYTIISGSHRPEAESLRIAQYTANRIEKNLKDAHAEIVSLSENPLPLWDEGAWENDSKWEKLWSPISKKLKAADALVVVSPEWSGMVPAGLKNFFLLCNDQEIAHKPALIVAVSAGTGGSYPVAELRMSSYKNTHLLYIPDHVILRKVGDLFKAPEPTTKEDIYLRKRLDYSLQVLEQYASALKAVRSSGVINAKDYANGM
jgi:NAD(P)H-dependent FMN reductase